MVYGIRGSASVQVVNENDNPILDDQVQEGLLFIVPQNHGVITQAGNKGFEYIAYKTTDNAMIITLAGLTSILRALPLEVLANAYQIHRQQAQQLKYNRPETIALSSSQSFQMRRDREMSDGVLFEEVKEIRSKRDRESFGCLLGFCRSTVEV
ncbi:prunin 1 Pru du 6.0101-like [Malus domestica]|uniref:prunin 1 Pru du 6.0101-like n=1 Tax=Malus domestica TaxID=3750 RepID=UPI003975C26E